MKLVIIFGPPAVGKMTVGKELSKITNFKLFHNHMTIDLVLNFFDYGEPSFHKLVSNFRNQIFEEISKSNLDGLIFTYVWAFDISSDADYIKKITEIFKNHEVFYVELEANLEERLIRNKSESRLLEKPSKKDIETSEKMLLFHDKEHKLNSDKNYFDNTKNYLRINNTNLLPEQVAKQIYKNFFISS
ncbi:MAG: AAA family ATPase [Candidatus Sericytochromatia bacterium]